MKKIKKIVNKKHKSKIISLTAYSKNIAEIIDKHVDIVLVGDSVASVLYNYDTTRKMKLDTMIEHAKSVRMGISNSLMVFDMPFNTYRNKKEALLNVRKVIKETKSDAVKLEGGSKIKDIVKHLIKNNIAVLGHLGIMPQSVRGKFKSKGKTSFERKKLLEDAKLLEKLGAFAIVLECIEKSSIFLTNISVQMEKVFNNQKPSITDENDMFEIGDDLFSSSQQTSSSTIH